MGRSPWKTKHVGRGIPKKYFNFFANPPPPTYFYFFSIPPSLRISNGIALRHFQSIRLFDYPYFWLQCPYKVKCKCVLAILLIYEKQCTMFYYMCVSETYLSFFTYWDNSFYCLIIFDMTLENVRQPLSFYNNQIKNWGWVLGTSLFSMSCFTFLQGWFRYDWQHSIS